MKKEIKEIYGKDLSATSKLIMSYFILEEIDKISISIDELSNIFNCSSKNNIYIIKGGK